jgi:hypothetical protein
VTVVDVQEVSIDVLHFIVVTTYGEEYNYEAPLIVAVLSILLSLPPSYV